jgi:flagellar basal body-associated protein FliL
MEEQNNNIQEQNNNIQEQKKEKGNSSKVIIALLGILIVLVLGVGILVMVKPTIFNFSAKSDDKESSYAITIKDLDLSKCINKKDYTYSKAKELTSEDEKVIVKINSDAKSITVGIKPKLQSSQEFKNFSKKESTDSTIEYQVSGFDKKISSVGIGGVGQSLAGMGIFAIMEDNTVTYVRLFEKSGNDYFFTLGEGKAKVRYVDDAFEVIKLYSVDVAAGTTGHASVIGATVDGSFYDLGLNYEKDQVSSTTTAPTTSTQTTDNKTETTKPGRKAVIGTVEIDLDNCVNREEGSKLVYSNPVNSTSQGNGLSVAKENDKTLNITIDYSKYGRLCKALGCKYSDGEVKKYTIASSEKITDYILGGRGQDFTSTAVFYLDESIGAAHVAKLYTKTKDSSGGIKYAFNNEPKASYVLGHDIIGLFNVTVQTEGASVGSHQTTIGVLQDGSFYDLGLWLDRNLELNN